MSANGIRLYITEQGAHLHRRDGLLWIEKEGETIEKFPLEQVEEIHLFGGIQLTTPVIHHCLQRGVTVSFQSQQGAYLGRLVAQDNAEAATRMTQYTRHLEPEFRLNVAKAIVEGKIHNQRVFVSRREASPDLEREGEELERFLKRFQGEVGSTSTLAELQGVEGVAALHYFQLFPCLLEAAMPYGGGRKRPATDPLNALLNLGYTLLYNDMLSALYAAGLDPYIGSFHELKVGHACLASDLMEEFRPVIVDSLITLMVNHHELTADDFDTQKTGETRLKPAAFKKFLGRYDWRVNTTTHYALTGERNTYRRIFRLQAYQYTRVLHGEAERYLPYLWER